MVVIDDRYLCFGADHTRLVIFWGMAPPLCRGATCAAYRAVFGSDFLSAARCDLPRSYRLDELKQRVLREGGLSRCCALKAGEKEDTE
jgi:hypothetical protein